MIVIKTASLKAAVLTAAVKDVRYCLKGVQIQVQQGGEIRIRSTDGAIVFEDRSEDKSLLEGSEFVIPIAVAKDLAKEKAPALTFSLKDDGRWECAGRIFSPLEGKFPDISRIIPPRKATDRAENFDFAYLALAQKAMRAARNCNGGNYRLQNPETAGGVGLIHCEDAEFPRVALVALRTPACFQKQ